MRGVGFEFALFLRLLFDEQPGLFLNPSCCKAINIASASSGPVPPSSLAVKPASRMLRNELDLLPRAFDVNVFSLPFTLPAERLVQSRPVLPLSPPHPLFPQPPPDGATWESVSNEALRLKAEAIDANTDMGISGGLGSGSCLGSRAQGLPAAKYRGASGPAPESGVVPLMRAVSGDQGPRPATAEEIEATVRDLAILDERPGWGSLLLTGLPGLLPGLDPMRPMGGGDSSWLLDCAFSRMLAGEGDSAVRRGRDPGRVRQGRH